MEESFPENLIRLRRELHRHPELSGQEVRTAQRIKAFLAASRPDLLMDGVGGHGVIAEYDFCRPGPTVLIRCELDALPIDEPNTFDYRSQVKGVAHKCGHDGHMAMVAGLAPWLRRQSFSGGRVILLFQPAEETGTGAKAMLEDPKFASILPDYVFALHNIPGYPLHQVIKVERQFSATVQSVAIYLRGLQCHAAEPEKGNNPAWAMAEITQTLQGWIVAEPAAPEFTLITPVYTRMGQPDYGISAGKGELHFTLRTWSVERMEALVQQLEVRTQRIAHDHGLTVDFAYFDYFPATRNAPAANEVVAQAARQLGLDIVSKEVPFKFGEDFGWLAQRFPGAMFGLGAGVDIPVLHHDHYDFPDELIKSGLLLFQEIIGRILAPERQ